MVRRVSMLGLAVAMMAAAGGCRTRCGGGLFTSSGRGDAPCHLAGATCVEGVPVSGGGGFPLGAPAGTVPGGGFGGSPSELPLPQPTDLIPRPGVPFAPPTPAPGDGGASVLPLPKDGVPVRR